MYVFDINYTISITPDGQKSGTVKLYVYQLQYRILEHILRCIKKTMYM